MMLLKSSLISSIKYKQLDVNEHDYIIMRTGERRTNTTCLAISDNVKHEC